jgi:hypothetical protein
MVPSRGIVTFDGASCQARQPGRPTDNLRLSPEPVWKVSLEDRCVMRRWLRYSAKRDAEPESSALDALEARVSHGLVSGTLGGTLTTGGIVAHP